MESVRFSIIENELKRISESGDGSDGIGVGMGVGVAINGFINNNDATLLFDKRSSISSESNCAGYSNELSSSMPPSPKQFIWDSKEIDNTLAQSNNNSMDILNIIKMNVFNELSNLTVNYHDDDDDNVNRMDNVQLALLYAILYGNNEQVIYLLDHCGADANCSDIRGRTALHFACCRANAHVAKILLDRGADPNRWDNKKEVTPLHCAVSAQSVDCILLLLKRKAHINIGLETRSALHFAIDRNAIECVEILLKYGADPNTPQVFTETPLHTACALGYSKCCELLLKHGADVRSQYGEGKLTALHLAAENDYANCVRLLLEHGAHVDARNASYQTPLHLASLSQSIESLEVLIKYGANVNACYRDGRTALHAAMVKRWRCLDCCLILLKAGANVNKADNFGFTPLHMAASNELCNCVYTFIEYGADVTARTDGNISALSFIVRSTPEIIPKLMQKMDASIKAHDHEIGDVNCEITLDFRLLVPPGALERGETELLLCLIEVGQKRFLMHPLCETFLFLKWRRIRKFYLMSVLYHALYVILFTMYIVGVYAQNCPKTINMVKNGTEIEQKQCTASQYIIPIGYFVITLNIILLAKELFQMAHGLQGYAKYWENWLQWSIIFGVMLCVTPEILVITELQRIPIWQHHVAAIVVLLVWLELMMLIGRFPIFGVYVQMFTKVAVNFGKFLMAYICLLIAFSLSFSVLFNEYKPFTNITWSLLKTIVMMSGELEFEDIFYGDMNIHYPVTAHFIFLSFVLLVTVILTNLMVGLAVSDIQGLQVSATLDRLIRQAELVSRLESLFFSRLLRGAPTKILQICKRSALLRTSRNNLQFIIRPNDSRDNKLPDDIKLNIYKLVANRRDRNLSMRRHKFEKNYGIFQKSIERPNSHYINRSAIVFDKDLRDNNRKSQAVGGHEDILRPKSVTNMPFNVLGPMDVSLHMKKQLNDMNEIRNEIKQIKQQIYQLNEKFDQFTNSSRFKKRIAGHKRKLHSERALKN